MKRNFLVVGLAIILLQAGAPRGAEAQSAESRYLNVSGIPGDATAQGHEKWIELVSIGQTLRPIKPSGVLCRTELLKRIDKASPKLWAAAAGAQSFAEMTIDTVRNDLVVLRETLLDVQVRRADFLAERTDPTSGLSMESIVLIPHSITLRHTTIDELGQVSESVEETFACSAN